MDQFWRQCFWIRARSRSSSYSSRNRVRFKILINEGALWPAGSLPLESTVDEDVLHRTHSLHAVESRTWLLQIVGSIYKPLIQDQKPTTGQAQSGKRFVIVYHRIRIGIHQVNIFVLHLTFKWYIRQIGTCMLLTRNCPIQTDSKADGRHFAIPRSFLSFFTTWPSSKSLIFFWRCSCSVSRSHSFSFNFDIASFCFTSALVRCVTLSTSSCLSAVSQFLCFKSWQLETLSFCMWCWAHNINLKALKLMLWSTWGRPRAILSDAMSSRYGVSKIPYNIELR